ncbi:DivIVA domain-containing protein [Microbacterium sp.]|uniref:DivIVA domain-containing protein n=1 Tax=Microbacterium sp. TaxID=51671 RepID=UPI0037C84F16
MTYDPLPTDDTAAAEPSARPAPFPDAPRGQKGYDKRAVEVFLARARAAFEAPGDDPPITSATVRDATFPLVKRGYAVAAVDAALGRIEDAFANREREEGIARAGVAGWVEGARATAQEVLDRLARPDGRRFARARGMRYGYRIDEVDLVSRKLIGYFERGEPVTVDQVRQAAFRMQRRGYREEQVDALLDAVVEVMLAVR